MTTIRLAHGGDLRRATTGLRQYEGREEVPSMLASFYYKDKWEEESPHFHFSEWVLDSGAFSAHAGGSAINIDEYILYCKHKKATDEKLVEIFALDVIGDHEASTKNTEYMWKHGIEAIPCFHYGEPWEVLTHIANNYPKIAIGGLARLKIGQQKLTDFIEQCFARVWPKKIHGFGITRPYLCEHFPFHTVDSTSWNFAPNAFGNWKTYGKLPLRGTKKYNLKHEVNWYLEFERRLKSIHRNSLKALQ